MINNPNHNENIEPHQWKPGQTGNPNGRPKKLLTQFKDIGYTPSQVNDTLQVLLAMGIDELKQIAADEAHTALERIVAGSIVNGHSKRSLYNLMSILDRAHGKPKESQEHNFGDGASFTLNLQK